MKSRVFVIATVIINVASADVYAHGSGGTQAIEADKRPLKLNIGARTLPSSEYRAEPNMDLSVEGQTLHLSVTDPEGNPIDTEIADAKTFVTIGGKISTLYLWPSGDNRLSGKGDFNPEPGMRVEVLLHLPDRETVRKEFYPLN